MSVSLPAKTGGPAFPPYPSDENKYGLSMLGWFAGHIAAGLCANPQVVDQAFIQTLLAPAPTSKILTVDPVASAPPYETPTALGVLEYTFDVNTVEPVSGNNVELDNGNQTAATKLWISKTTADGIDATKPLVAINELYGVYMQDKDDSSRNMSYNVIGPSIDKGSYVEVPVIFTVGGAPLPAQRILLSIFKQIAYSDLTPEVLAKIAYTIASEMVNLRDQMPIEPMPNPPIEPEPPVFPPPLPAGPHGVSVTVGPTT